MKVPTFPSPAAVALWNESERFPKFVHMACLRGRLYGWSKVGGAIEIRDFDRCTGCGGSMFEEPKR